jgi:hypothetical protein
MSGAFDPLSESSVNARVAELLTQSPQNEAEADKLRLEIIATMKWWPEKLAMYLWRWDEGELAGIEEPDVWQMEDLAWLGSEMRQRKREFEETGTAPKILEATGSGRGIGKNVKISMLAVMFMAAFPDAKISVLANTGAQLETKTWPGIRTWLRRSLVAHWFEINSSIMFRIGARESWFCVPITWSLENTQASAGQHNLGSANIFLFDELSQIPGKIIEVALAGLVTGLAVASGIGNPTQPDGVLADALNGKTPTEMNPSPYGKWHARSIDSRTCRFPNKTEIAEMVGYYGEESDWVRVWVRGIPPKGSIHGYFGETLIASGRAARPRGTSKDALVAAVDFAWGGDDNNNIAFGEGLDMWSIKPIIIPGRETARPEKMIQVLAEVMTREWPCTSGANKRVAMLFGDGSGICTEVFAGLYTLGITNVMAVNWSGVPRDQRIHKNIKAQLMSAFRDALLDGAGVGDDEDLAQDMRELVCVNFLPLQFEKKEFLKKRLGRSTDGLDSKAMLRYMPVMLPAIQQEAAGWRNVNTKPYKPTSAYS